MLFVVFFLYKGYGLPKEAVVRVVGAVTVVDGRAVGLPSSHADRARIVRGADPEGDARWARRRALEGVERAARAAAVEGAPRDRRLGRDGRDVGARAGAERERGREPSHACQPAGAVP